MDREARPAARVRLLADCAALAHSLAPHLCAEDLDVGGSCAWYHGFWPYMRLLDYGSSPELHKGFYLEGLAPLAAGGEPRILISGAADFAMLEVAREAFAGGRARPEFTVIDRCETPLALCRWFTGQAGFAIETQAADVLAYEAAPGFDAIVTHSFLGNFPPEVRPRLAQRWFALLRPGGRVLTINRVRGREAAAATRFSTQEAGGFQARLLADLERHRAYLPCPPAQIAALAEPYLREKRSHPVRTREELADLFHGAGFELECFAELEASDPGRGRPSGPTMPGGASYMKVIARRRL